MIKIIIILFMMGSTSQAKVSTKKLGDFPQLCYESSRKIKNYPQYCECVKTNLRWLVDDNDWSKTKDIYTGKISQAAISNGDKEGLTELDTMIVNIELACLKSNKYIAPKAKRLMSNQKN